MTLHSAELTPPPPPPRLSLFCQHRLASLRQTQQLLALSPPVVSLSLSPAAILGSVSENVLLQEPRKHVARVDTKHADHQLNLTSTHGITRNHTGAKRKRVGGTEKHERRQQKHRALVNRRWRRGRSRPTGLTREQTGLFCECALKSGEGNQEDEGVGRFVSRTLRTMWKTLDKCPRTLEGTPLGESTQCVVCRGSLRPRARERTAEYVSMPKDTKRWPT